MQVRRQTKQPEWLAGVVTAYDESLREDPSPTRPQVGVLGAGFAGLNAVHALRRVEADVTLLDKNNCHIFQPLLYQVSTGYLPPEEVGAALRAVFRRQTNLTVRLAELIRVNWAQRALS